MLSFWKRIEAMERLSNAETVSSSIHLAPSQLAFLDHFEENLISCLCPNDEIVVGASVADESFDHSKMQAIAPQPSSRVSLAPAALELLIALTATALSKQRHADHAVLPQGSSSGNPSSSPLRTRNFFSLPDARFPVAPSILSWTPVEVAIAQIHCTCLSRLAALPKRAIDVFWQSVNDEAQADAAPASGASRVVPGRALSVAFGSFAKAVRQVLPDLEASAQQSISDGFLLLVWLSTRDNGGGAFSVPPEPQHYTATGQSLRLSLSTLERWLAWFRSPQSATSPEQLQGAAEVLVARDEAAGLFWRKLYPGSAESLHSPSLTPQSAERQPRPSVVSIGVMSAVALSSPSALLDRMLRKRRRQDDDDDENGIKNKMLSVASAVLSCHRVQAVFPEPTDFPSLPLLKCRSARGFDYHFRSGSVLL